MKYKLVVDSDELRLIHDCISYTYTEGSLLKSYSVTEFINLMDVVANAPLENYQEAYDFVKSVVGNDVSRLSKESVVKLFDSFKKGG